MFKADPELADKALKLLSAAIWRGKKVTDDWTRCQCEDSNEGCSEPMQQLAWRHSFVHPQQKNTVSDAIDKQLRNKQGSKKAEDVLTIFSPS